MNLLDEHFRFGSLRLARVTVRVTTPDMPLAPGRLGEWDRPYRSIIISAVEVRPDSPPKERSLYDVVQTNIKNTKGACGHGPAFRVLYDCVIQVTALWHAELKLGGKKYDEILKLYEKEELESSTFRPPHQVMWFQERSCQHQWFHKWDTLIGLAKEVHINPLQIHVEHVYYERDASSDWVDSKGKRLLFLPEPSRWGETEVHHELLDTVAKLVTEFD
ncbi:hypothetical protein BJ170DRAFT_735198 [Xylariales sp. AK1849]|nr:hypothetical protein BJ170DRAFT_735198 [Xylariales sp. AK1849]